PQVFPVRDADETASFVELNQEMIDSVGGDSSHRTAEALAAEIDRGHDDTSGVVGTNRGVEIGRRFSPARLNIEDHADAFAPGRETIIPSPVFGGKSAERQGLMG